MSKERLVELIGQAKSVEASGIDCEVTDEYISDYLLANGVIVLPCKVGDIVYETDGVRIYELEIFDISLRKNKPYYETESIDFDDDAIGKSIFLTRKEAEAKLRKEDEGK